MDENAKTAVRDAYDALADTYAAERSIAGDELDILDAFADSLPAGPRVLDAGCGQGTPVLRRLDDAATATGLDFSREQLDLAAGTVPGAPLVQGDMTRLPFRDDAFDAVTAIHSLIHVPLAAHGTVADEFARVLAPGGRLLCSEGAVEWTGANPDWLDSGVEMRWEIAGAEATRSHLEEAGFEILERWDVPDTVADEEGATKPFFAARLDR
ncbi:class I SAM-dependent methyltransferase [Halosolutus amylolyticus]|uniref:Class I SAM-dependent methyltransferase n=1 Tax=Halosolutus amylolyticus TaxID=2932267 RepID=A0ABD5PRE1_9EURY|nr:class I SAM-dependent methyltransferase [Halosolutus amylolyticus]